MLLLVSEKILIKNHSFMFQGKGLMQTYWLMEELQIESQHKNKPKMYQSNWKKLCKLSSSGALNIAKVNATGEPSFMHN